MPVRAVRVPWNAFPDVIVHSSIYKLKCLPAYFAAKRGDHKAASRIAHALVKTENIAAVQFVVPVIQVAGGRYNAIPVAFGAVLAKHIGARLWLDVCQTNKVDHTDAGAQGRLQNQPIFGGLPPKGKCLICDDVVTYGATLANLRGFLISTGAEVLAATAIGAAYGSTKLAPELSLIVKLRRRYGEELEIFTETLGFGSDCLTAREAHFFAGMRTVERIRDCLAQRVGSTNRSRSIRI